MQHKTKPMEIQSDGNHVDLLIERDAGNPFLVLMGKKEYALPNWRKLKTLCNKAIGILSGDEKQVTDAKKAEAFDKIKEIAITWNNNEVDDAPAMLDILSIVSKIPP